MPIVLNNGIDQILGIMELTEYYCSNFVAINVISRKAFYRRKPKPNLSPVS